LAGEVPKQFKFSIQLAERGRPMLNIAILGYGTVGSGVFDVLGQNSENVERQVGQPVKVKRVFVRRDYPGSEADPYVTRDIDDIMNDGDIRIVVEAMGGLEPAYSYAKRGLSLRKHIVTSNKELVAEYGAELLALARDNGVNFLFEASVGGGVPLIAPIARNLLFDEILYIEGILNGTSNYILTEMNVAGKGFAEALREAQASGYAESDPAADVEGLDACRKLSILLSLVSGRRAVWTDIETQGIARLTEADFLCAKSLAYNIKLIAGARLSGLSAEAYVAPRLVPYGHPLYSADGVYNSVLLGAKVVGNVMFYGHGAGKYPTASAVVSDVIEAARKINENTGIYWSSETLDIVPPTRAERRMIRAECGEGFEAAAARLWPGAPRVSSKHCQRETAWLTEAEDSSAAREKLAALEETSPGTRVLNVISIIGI
jgi:homoserine dehydrogenase